MIGPNAAELHLGGYSNDPGRGVSVSAGNQGQGRIERRGALFPRLQDHRNACPTGTPTKSCSAIRRSMPNAFRTPSRSRRKRTSPFWPSAGTSKPRARPGQRTIRRSRQPRSSRQPGRSGEGNSRHGKAGCGLPDPRPSQFHQLSSLRTFRQFSMAGIWGRKAEPAAADVIFGDYNPGGKLPITVPRSVGQLPDYYYQKPTAKREYLGSTTLPLFPFRLGPQLFHVQVSEPPDCAGFNRPGRRRPRFQST